MLGITEILPHFAGKLSVLTAKSSMVGQNCQQRVLEITVAL